MKIWQQQQQFNTSSQKKKTITIGLNIFNGTLLYIV